VDFRWPTLRSRQLEEIVVQLRKLTSRWRRQHPRSGAGAAVAQLVPRSIYERRIERFNEHVTATAPGTA